MHQPLKMERNQSDSWLHHSVTCSSPHQLDYIYSSKQQLMHKSLSVLIKLDQFKQFVALLESSSFSNAPPSCFLHI